MRITTRRFSRERYPGEKLLIMFDIDGTIVDTRYMILHGLREHDRATGTEMFRDLEVSRITVSESRVQTLLDELGLDDHDVSREFSCGGTRPDGASMFSSRRTDLTRASWKS